VINKFWGFTLPSVLTERYAPSSVDASQVPNIQNVDLKHSSYKEWKIEVEIKSDQPFRYINNPSHNLKPELSENSKIYKAIWNVTVVPNKNFVVYFRSDKIEHPSTILATHPNYTDDHVLLVNFIPQLNKLDVNEAQKSLDMGEEGFLRLKNLALKEDVESAKGEFIFVIDRSGSMDGARIVNLKKALEKFLTILPKDSLFNILSFGSTFSLYKAESLKLNAENLKEAVEWIRTIDADMGGTEILPALRSATQVPQVQGYPRTIMVLTDGDVFNPAEVISHVRENSEKVRVCSVGIGYGASEYLVKNIGKAGRCTSEFVLDDEDIGDKAIYMIKAAISQYLENIESSIECFDSKNKAVFKEESKHGLLLKDEPFKKWTYFKNISDLEYCNAKISYFNSLKKEKATEEFRVDGFKTAEITPVWHKVAYDSKLKELDLEVKAEGRDFDHTEQVKATIIELSLKYQVLSDYTSFLAVLEESTVDPQDDRIKETIKNVDSADYAYVGGAGHQNHYKMNIHRGVRSLASAASGMESVKFAARRHVGHQADSINLLAMNAAVVDELDGASFGMAPSGGVAMHSYDEGAVGFGDKLEEKVQDLIASARSIQRDFGGNLSVKTVGLGVLIGSAFLLFCILSRRSKRVEENRKKE